MPSDMAGKRGIALKCAEGRLKINLILKLIAQLLMSLTNLVVKAKTQIQ